MVSATVRPISRFEGWACAALALLAAVPLLVPGIPPLIDLLGHMGRYRIMTAGPGAVTLAQSFHFEWKLLGNLGVDLLIVPMAKLFGVELGTKLIVLAIPPLTVVGMLWLAREAHGRTPQAALFALPLAYAFPFQFGFLNFSLSIALALNALALWTRLGRSGQLGLRAALFVPLACLLWLTHTVGWGLFGLSAFGAELVRRHRAGEPIVRAGFLAGVQCISLALPLVPMILLRSTAPGAETFDWFNWSKKLLWTMSLLRDRWADYDLICASLLFAVLGLALIWRRLEPMLFVPALLCSAAFILMPRVVTGSAYADMRLLPFATALALLAIRPVTSSTWGKWIAAAGLLFFVTRLAGTTASFLIYDRSYRDELHALDHLPQGASVLSLVVRPCGNAWTTERLDHVPALAIVRRDAFTNDQWTVDSAQGLTVIKPGVGPDYDNDPSQLVYPKGCRREGSDLGKAIAAFPRAAFDHVWVLNGHAIAPDLQPVWSNGHSTLYRVVRGKESE